MKGLSVVIPCYNASASIIDCLKSLENDYIDIEAIIIEDNSKIDCRDIINDFSKKTRIEIKYYMNDVNIGPGRTRNRGITKATREYITFLDSDDSFAPDYFENIKTPLELGYDEIIYNAKRIYVDKEYNMNMFYSDKLSEGEIERNKALVYIKGCTCGKIYKTKNIIGNSIVFGEMPRNEDMVFTKIATAYSERIYYIDKSLYRYYDNPNSLMNDTALRTTENARRAYECVCERLKPLDLKKEMNSIYYIEILYSAVNTLLMMDENRVEVKRRYRDLRRGYDFSDPYRKGYKKIYYFPLFFFEAGFFMTYKKLRSALKKK